MKRNVMSLAAKFFDPLSIVSPLTINFKVFFQRLCESKVDWDQLLDSEQYLTSAVTAEGHWCTEDSSLLFP